MPDCTKKLLLAAICTGAMMSSKPCFADFYTIETRTTTFTLSTPYYGPGSPFGSSIESVRELGFLSHTLGEQTAAFAGPGLGSILFEDYVLSQYNVDYRITNLKASSIPAVLGPPNNFARVWLAPYATRGTTPPPAGLPDPGIYDVSQGVSVRFDNTINFPASAVAILDDSFSVEQSGPYYVNYGLEWLESSDYTNSPTAANSGSLKFEVEVVASHRFEGDAAGVLSRAVNWVENFFREIPTSPTRILRDSLRIYNPSGSLNTEEERRPVSIPGSSGIRGSIDSDGYSVRTASPGILTFDTTLPEIETLDIPVVFGSGHDLAQVEVLFDGDILASFSGSDFEQDLLSFLSVDLNDYAGETGQLQVILNTPSTEGAEIFIPDSFNVLGVIPEPSSLVLLGTSVLLATSRRRQLTS